jgi:tetratricopeptide (TPR) repeat protein
LIRQVVYDDVVSPRRALLHRRVAEGLEAIHAGDLDPRVTALASHYRAAGAWREAAHYLERAGLRSAAHSAHRDAAISFEQALSALVQAAETQETRIRTSELRFRLGYSLAITGRFAEALECYETSAALAGRSGAVTQQWLAETACGSALGSLGRYAEAVARCEPVRAAAEATGDARGQFWIDAQLARLHFALGDCRRSLGYARSAGACLGSGISVEGVGPDFPPELAWRSWAVLGHSMLGEFAVAENEAAVLQRALEDPSASIHARLLAGGSLGTFCVARGEIGARHDLAGVRLHRPRARAGRRPAARGDDRAGGRRRAAVHAGTPPVPAG